MFEQIIPSGKHRGKKLPEISTPLVIALYSSWRNSPKLKKKPFYKQICKELRSRGYAPGKGNAVQEAGSKRQDKALRRVSSKTGQTVGGTMHAVDAFKTTKADETVAYQNELILRGELGQIAFGLFRAQKRSTKAKSYRGAMRRNSYDGKGEALQYLDAALTLWDAEFGINWGWKKDPKQEYHNQVLYVELPGHGQCSFHSSAAAGPKQFGGEWDSSKPVIETVLEFCDFVIQSEDPRPMRDTDLMPFGKHVGKLLGEIDGGYWNWLADWEGLSNWLALEPFIKARVS